MVSYFFDFSFPYFILNFKSNFAFVYTNINVNFKKFCVYTSKILIILYLYIKILFFYISTKRKIKLTNQNISQLIYQFL